LLAQVTEWVESILYQDMRVLEETNILLEYFGDHFKKIKQQEGAELFYQEADGLAKQARVVHDLIFKRELLSGDRQFQKKHWIIAGAQTPA
jgi:two-component system, chemotaxis family, protein-glutamate methylesterase/glutaminase